MAYPLRIVRLFALATLLLLCVPLVAEGQSFVDYDREALRLEREVYTATSPADHNRALLAKSRVRKQQGLFDEALSELARIYTWALGEDMGNYYYERALCSYLAGRYEEALATIDEAEHYLEASALGGKLALIEALAAGERGLWERSQGAAERFVAEAYASDPEKGVQMRAALGEIYASTPRMRNPQVAWWLSLLPGVGQIYAGEVWRGLVSMAGCGLLGGFAVSEMIAGQWLSGWVVGCGGLSSSYFVGQERARALTERRNQRLLATHNELLRATLLGD